MDFPAEVKKAAGLNTPRKATGIARQRLQSAFVFLTEADCEQLLAAAGLQIAVFEGLQPDVFGILAQESMKIDENL